MKVYFHNIKWLSKQNWDRINETFLADAFLEIWNGMKYVGRGLIFVGIYKIIFSLIVILFRVIFIGILGFITIPLISHFQLNSIKKEKEKEKNENTF